MFFKTKIIYQKRTEQPQRNLIYKYIIMSFNELQLFYGFTFQTGGHVNFDK